jgi:hypothetical protein
MGKCQSYRIMQDKYAVLACLRTLANVEYHIPSFSYMMLRALNEGIDDVARLCANIAAHNLTDVVSLK